MPRLPDVRRPPRIDLVVAAFFVVLTVAEAFTNPDARSGWQLALALVAAAALALRRQYAVEVAVLVVVVNLLTNPTGELSTILSLVLVSFSVGFETDPPRSGIGLAVVLVPFLLVQLATEFVPSDLAAGAMFIGGPWGVGAATRQRTKRAAEAMARAELLEREQAERAERAVREERTRIARELHDVVSHSISVVTIQTQAVRRRLDPGQEREIEDLARIEATARDAMAEMRRLFGVLRGPGDGPAAALAPQPGLHDLPALVERTTSPTTEVVLRVEGAPLALPPGLDLAAFRVAQEAVTNAVKHARATRVEVVLAWTATTLTLTVADDGRGADVDRGGLRGDGAGQGLPGMRERVALYGGDVEVSTRPGAGFVVTARLPLAGR